MPIESSEPERAPSPKPAPEEPAKPIPRPYISRRTSSASIRSQDSAGSVPPSPSLSNLPEGLTTNGISGRPASPSILSPRSFLSRRSSTSSLRSQETSATTPVPPPLTDLPENEVVNVSSPLSPTGGTPLTPRSYMPRRKTSNSSLDGRS
jgi:hypothetical protein